MTTIEDMAMMTDTPKMTNSEDYVSYEQAVKLKELGFSIPCDSYYDCRHNLKHYATFDCINRNTNGHHTPSCSAPSLWQAQKWLREKKKIDVLVYNCACGYLWEVSKVNSGTGLILFDEKGDDENSGCWTSYDAALSAGIDAALELI